MTEADSRPCRQGHIFQHFRALKREGRALILVICKLEMPGSSCEPHHSSSSHGQGIPEKGSSIRQTTYVKSMLIIVLLVSSWHSPDDPFDLFGIGNQCVEDHEWRNSFMDDVRWFAEDCDSLQVKFTASCV